MIMNFLLINGSDASESGFNLLTIVVTEVVYVSYVSSWCHSHCWLRFDDIYCLNWVYHLQTASTERPKTVESSFSFLWRG